MSGVDSWVSDDTEPRTPFAAGWAFCLLLAKTPLPIEELQAHSTPESVPHWDYRAAAAAFLAIEWPGFPHGAHVAEGADDVAYLPILSSVEHDATAAQLSQETVLSLVWRPEVGRWLVHSMGQPVLPDSMPRTAPSSN
jgi:hypothetical protein